MQKEGDRVKIITKDEEFEGLLMPRPEILSKDITVLKLDNGYNMGIEKKKIKKIKLIEKYKEKKPKKIKLKHNPKLPNITIISTGGTISSRIDYRTGGVYADYTAEDFVAMCPELQNIANLRAKQLISKMSEDFTSKDWIAFAKTIQKELEHSDGVVITQGTDTLHYTTAALSFFLKNLSKPVIITAAQRSIDRGSSDAFMNLICSVKAAASDIAEVMSCLHGTTNDDYCLLIKGTKVRKMHTSRRDAFRPINDLPIAKVYLNKIEIINKNYNKKSTGSADLDAKFEEKIALINVYPGMDMNILDFHKGYKGFVIAATALGHVSEQFLDKIKKIIDKKIPVIIASQTLYGRVHPFVYSKLRDLSIKLGCIFVEDMLPETAYVKLGWVLSHTTKPEEVKKMMLDNIAGEFTERSLKDTYLY
ncbi:Glu-tRNA(Gln) amidotransferase subunit GatD [Candidatus Woesearchaeota archaeon]|nr:Glu-tRNA(Gln) amidotransferase subunit GatD [Candidatus Woesearchaeota archaeon]